MLPTVREWGKDALMLTGYGRRRSSYIGAWSSDWESLSRTRLIHLSLKRNYQLSRHLIRAFLAVLVDDINLIESRSSYNRSSRPYWNPVEIAWSPRWHIKSLGAVLSGRTHTPLGDPPGARPDVHASCRVLLTGWRARAITADHEREHE